MPHHPTQHLLPDNIICTTKLMDLIHCELINLLVLKTITLANRRSTNGCSHSSWTFADCARICTRGREASAFDSTLVSPRFSGGGGGEGWEKQLIHRSIFICRNGHFLFRCVPCVRRCKVTLACKAATICKFVNIVPPFLTLAQKNGPRTIRTYNS